MNIINLNKQNHEKRRKTKAKTNRGRWWWRSNTANNPIPQLLTMRKRIKDLPFILLSIDIIWWVLSFWGIYSHDYWVVLEFFSHSLSFCFFMAFYAYVHRYCYYSWACIIGLALLNLVNIFYYFIPIDYFRLYIGVILITTFVFAIILKLKKHVKQRQ